MNWQRASRDVMTLHHDDGTYAGYFVVRHKIASEIAQKWYYNGWRGDFRDRDIREYVSAGFDRDAVMAACEARSGKALEHTTFPVEQNDGRRETGG